MTDAATTTRHEPKNNISFYRLESGDEVPFTVVHLTRPYPHPAAFLPLPSDELYLWTETGSRDPVRAAKDYFQRVAQERDDRYCRPGWLPTAFDAEYCSGHLSFHDGTVMVHPQGNPPQGNPWRGLAAAGLLQQAGLRARVKGLFDGKLYTLGPRLDTVFKHDLEWLLNQGFHYRVMLAPLNDDALVEAAARNSLPSGLFTALSHSQGAALIQVHNPLATNVALLRNGNAPTPEERDIYNIAEQQPVHSTDLEKMLEALSDLDSGVYLAPRREPAPGFVPTYLYAGTFDELCEAVGTIRHPVDDTPAVEGTREGHWRPLRLSQPSVPQPPAYSIQ